MSFDLRLRISLLGLRLGVALVFAFWALDKLVNPAHSAQVFAGFYRLPEISQALLAGLGAAQLLLTAVFALGIAKRFSYGAVLLLHGISTVSSYGKYLEPFSGLLFFAAWPMLAACLALYLLRDSDTLASLGGKAGRRPEISSRRLP